MSFLSLLSTESATCDALDDLARRLPHEWPGAADVAMVFYTTHQLPQIPLLVARLS